METDLLVASGWRGPGAVRRARRLVVQYGADGNEVDAKTGLTPVVCAIVAGNPAMACMLLDHGACWPPPAVLALPTGRFPAPQRLMFETFRRPTTLLEDALARYRDVGRSHLYGNAHHSAPMSIACLNASAVRGRAFLTQLTIHQTKVLSGILECLDLPKVLYPIIITFLAPFLPWCPDVTNDYVQKLRGTSDNRTICTMRQFDMEDYNTMQRRLIVANANN